MKTPHGTCGPAWKPPSPAAGPPPDRRFRPPVQAPAPPLTTPARVTPPKQPPPPKPPPPIPVAVRELLIERLEIATLAGSLTLSTEQGAGILHAQFPDDFHEPPAPKTPTATPPRSQARVDAYAARDAAGEGLRHPADATADGPGRGAAHELDQRDRGDCPRVGGRRGGRRRRRRRGRGRLRRGTANTHPPAIGDNPPRTPTRRTQPLAPP